MVSLVNNPKPAKSPKSGQRRALVPLEDKQQDVGGRDPEELVEGVHRDERPEHEEVGRHEDRERRYALGEGAAPELTRH
jgi:hypothetical protein